MKVYFLDTNVFLQCRDLKDLPWKDIADGHDLQLLIPRPVQEEIDKQKSDGGTRRGKRARKVSAFFRDIILSESMSIVIKGSDPHIEVTFSDTKSTNSSTIESLDMTRADDRIIDEVYTYRNNHPESLVYLLTHDTNPMLTCKKLGIPFSVVPDDWLSPPEPDTRDKKINELEQKLKKMEQIRPDIEIVTHDENNAVIASACIDVTRYTALDENIISELVLEASNRRPMKTDFDEPKEPKLPASLASSTIGNHILGIEWYYEKISEKEIEKYRSEDYPKWLSNLQSFYRKLPLIVGFSERHCNLKILIFNNGTLPAENLVIEFKAVGGLLMVSPKGKEELYGKLTTEPPTPPKAPEGKWVQRKRGQGLFDHLNSFGSLNRIDEHIRPFVDIPNLRRDRNAFYWKNDGPKHYTEQWVYECEEFRHQVGPEVFELMVFIPPKKEVIKGGISCLVSAKNLPVPVEMFFPININYNQVDTFEIAQNLLPDTLPVFKLKGM